MIELNNINNIYLYAGVTDFRIGINGLTSIVINTFKNEKSLNNNLYLFSNKKRNQIKILEINSTGIWLYIKKLNASKFAYPSMEGSYKITKDDLRIIISGLDFIQRIEGKTDIKYSYN